MLVIYSTTKVNDKIERKKKILNSLYIKRREVNEKSSRRRWKEKKLCVMITFNCLQILPTEKKTTQHN